MEFLPCFCEQVSFLWEPHGRHGKMWHSAIPSHSRLPCHQNDKWNIVSISLTSPRPPDSPIPCIVELTPGVTSLGSCRRMSNYDGRGGSRTAEWLHPLTPVRPPWKEEVKGRMSAWFQTGRLTAQALTYRSRSTSHSAQLGRFRSKY